MRRRIVWASVAGFLDHLRAGHLVLELGNARLDPALLIFCRMVFGVFRQIAMGAGLGVMVPVTLDKARIDPAVSSAVFVTTMTDVMGFFSFLGLAALFLTR